MYLEVDTIKLRARLSGMVASHVLLEIWYRQTSPHFPVFSKADF
jgi:hypothetical protein